MRPSPEMLLIRTDLRIRLEARRSRWHSGIALQTRAQVKQSLSMPTSYHNAFMIQNRNECSIYVYIQNQQVKNMKLLQVFTVGGVLLGCFDCAIIANNGQVVSNSNPGSSVRSPSAKKDLVAQVSQDVDEATKEKTLTINLEDLFGDMDSDYKFGLDPDGREDMDK